MHSPEPRPIDTYVELLLQNIDLLHLIDQVGKTIDECVYLFGLLDKHCHLQLMVEAAAANGIPKSIISTEDAEYTAKTTGYWETMYLSVCLPSVLKPFFVRLTCIIIYSSRLNTNFFSKRQTTRF